MDKDAVFLAGFVSGLFGGGAIPAKAQEVIDRVMGESAAPITKHHTVEAAVMIEPEVEPAPTDEEKIAAHIEQYGVVKKERKMPTLTQEQRDAASVRMKALQARRKAEREAAATITIEGKPIEDAQVEDWRSRPEPEIHEPTEGAGKLGEYFQKRTDTPPEILIEKHNEYAGKRDPDQALTDEDWADIQPRCQRGHHFRQIASDYDVEPSEMRAFIDRKLIEDVRASDSRKRGT